MTVAIAIKNLVAVLNGVPGRKNPILPPLARSLLLGRSRNAQAITRVGPLTIVSVAAENAGLLQPGIASIIALCRTLRIRPYVIEDAIAWRQIAVLFAFSNIGQPTPELIAEVGRIPIQLTDGSSGSTIEFSRLLESATGFAIGAYAGAAAQVRPLIVLIACQRILVVGASVVVAEALQNGLRELLAQTI